MKPVVREFDARAAIPTTCGGDWTPLCEIDAAALQKSLYASHPKFYSWMLERKEIEENWVLHEYEKDSSEYSQTKKVHCKTSGGCNVATGGLYLCPAVLLGIREVATTISSRQKFCVVGSGSLVIEAWVLETTELDVVSFDLFVTEHQRRIAERLRAVYDSSRWTQVRELLRIVPSTCVVERLSSTQTFAGISIDCTGKKSRNCSRWKIQSCGFNRTTGSISKRIAHLLVARFSISVPRERKTAPVTRT